MMKRVRLFYLSAGDILKGRVEPILWMKTCEWFHWRGIDVRLITTYFFRRENIKKKDIFKHFGIHSEFEFTILPTLISNAFSNITWVRANLLVVYLGYLIPLFLRKGLHIFYTKNRICMELVCFLEKVFRKDSIKVYEIHKIGRDEKLFRLLKKMDLVVVNSLRVETLLTENGVSKDRILIAYLAPHSEGAIIGREEARKQIGITGSKTVVAYVGKIYEENLSFFIETAKLLNNSNFELHIGGGNPTILRKASLLIDKHKLDNIVFHGFIPPSKVSIFTSASDFLFCSYSNDLPNIDQATPAKYFDYMHARKPFFCSNNTAIKELLINGENCIYFEPENPSDFVNKLNYYYKKQNILEKMVRTNDLLIASLNWRNRTCKITNRIQNLLAKRGIDCSFVTKGNSLRA